MTFDPAEKSGGLRGRRSYVELLIFAREESASVYVYVGYTRVFVVTQFCSKKSRGYSDTRAG